MRKTYLRHHDAANQKIPTFNHILTMKIGIPKEIKNNENRVGATPSGVKELVAHGHELYVQDHAGEGSGFSNDEYIKAGAKILPWRRP